MKRGVHEVKREREEGRSTSDTDLDASVSEDECTRSVLVVWVG